MNKISIFAAASMAALLSAVPAFAQANQQQGGGFVTLDLNWTEGNAPAESGLDGDTMRQILERDQARVRMIQERTKAKAPAIKPELIGNGEAKEEADAPKNETAPADVTLRPTTVTIPVAPPDSSRPRSISSDQMRQIVERDRARAKGISERIRAAQIEAEAEKYLKEHSVEFTPGKTPAGWTDNFTAAVGKAKAENATAANVAEIARWFIVRDSLLEVNHKANGAGVEHYIPRNRRRNFATAGKKRIRLR